MKTTTISLAHLSNCYMLHIHIQKIWGKKNPEKRLTMKYRAKRQERLKAYQRKRNPGEYFHPRGRRTRRWRRTWWRWWRARPARSASGSVSQRMWRRPRGLWRTEHCTARSSAASPTCRLRPRTDRMGSGSGRVEGMIWGLGPRWLPRGASGRWWPPKPGQRRSSSLCLPPFLALGLSHCLTPISVFSCFSSVSKPHYGIMLSISNIIL